MLSVKRLFAGFVLPVVFCAGAAEAVDVFSVVDFGAVPDGKTLSTSAIQKAIDACANGGGGVVRFPAGVFRSGALVMKSGVTLEITAGATLLGSRNREDYYLPQLDENGAPIDGASVFRNLIHGDDLKDIAIRGSGTIDGQGDAFRDKTKRRTKAIYLENCRNVLIQDVNLTSAGSWMQHYRLCRNLTIRNINVFNHVAFNNDGLNIDSCQDVTIAGCRVDSDDDGIVMKSLSDRPCRNVTITDCTVSSHCNALKMGTESGGGFMNMTIRNCRVFSPRHSAAIYGRQRGLAGIALEIVDGGRMENVTVSDVDIEGVSVPIFLRLGNRARRYGAAAQPGIGTLRSVTLRNITARHTSAIGCSITGLPGHPIEDVLLDNIDLGFEGEGTVEDARREIPEREASYPESTMFGTLPAYGFYCRHARGLEFRDVRLHTEAADLRPAMVFDDVNDLQINGLDALFSSGAPAMLRMVQVKGALVRDVAAKSAIGTFLHVEGEETKEIVLENNRFIKVETLIDPAPEVVSDAVTNKQ